MKKLPQKNDEFCENIKRSACNIKYDKLDTIYKAKV